MLEIKITTDNETPVQDQIEAAMAALGFQRRASSQLIPPIPQRVVTVAYTNPESGETVVVEPPETGPKQDTGPDVRGVMNVGLEHALADAEAAQKPGIVFYVHASGRKPGEPSPGHKRRTKAEIAEDDAYLSSKSSGDDHPLQPENVPVVEGKDFDLTLDIPVFDATAENVETIAQDAADEAAEAAEQSQGLEVSWTLEDLRRAVGDYAKKHGLPKAQANTPGIIGAKMVDVTDYETAIRRVQLATATSDGLLHEEEVQATLDDVKEAVRAYADKYEGKDAPLQAGTITAVDLAEIMRKTFPGTSGAIRDIPQTPQAFGKALTAVNAAVLENPFKREVK